MARTAAAVLPVLLLGAGRASAQSPLNVGEPIDRAITAGAAHAYTIALDGGDYVVGAVAIFFSRFQRNLAAPPNEPSGRCT